MLHAFSSLAVLLVLAVSALAVAGETGFRPPAVPLITHDPYFSVWSVTDHPAHGWSQHWTGATHAMSGQVRIDDQCYRILGAAPADLPLMTLKAVTVWPTRTVYEFQEAGVALTLTFTSPLLPNDPEVLSRSASYVTWQARATAGRPDVALYLDVTGEWVVDQTAQRVTASRVKLGDLTVLRLGSVDQPILGRAGDNVRIDWGHLYAAAPQQPGTTGVISSDRAARTGFARDGTLPADDDLRFPRAANDGWPVLAFAFDLGRVSPTPTSRHLVLAYDDIWAMTFLQRRLRPYWRRDGADAGDLLRAAVRDYEALRAQCEAFDEALMRDLTAVGGEKYARIAALSYRQCVAANKLVADFDGTPLMFSKENFSNGCTGTVDVIYPAAPLFLLLNPDLLKAQLTPVLRYAASSRWPFPFAPHDVGTYPLANGQVYGGGEWSEENQMPIEECGNMLLMVAAIAHADGNAEFARAHWPVITQWAEYLRDNGLDPENQLCTDDFAGHLAHNANLSLKAILALGGYARVCELAGEQAAARSYRALAEQMAADWQRMADDGDHYRLAFDQPGTWSQKYNLVWDAVLGLNLFPQEVARREMAWYRTKQNKYGLPLDNRADYTKTDWVVWTAALADSRAAFEAIIDPVYRFVCETPNRVPLTDWYDTKTGRQVGFQARPVIGGVYMPMLKDAAVWRKWRR